jgi:RHS repeat-associated protein
MEVAHEGRTGEPEGLALDSKGDVWVIDSGNARAQEFSSTGAYMSQFGSHGTPLGELDAPKGVAVDSKGDEWVADTNKSRVLEFSPTGESILSVGSEGTGPGELKAPRAVAINPEGDVLVVDQSNDRVEEYEATGKYIREFGGAGKEPRDLAEPQGIAIDKEGHIWVADTGDHRIKEFSSTGTYIAEFGKTGEKAGELEEPKNLAIDSSGNILVSDAWNDRIDEFNSAGTYLTGFGSYGSAPGDFHQPQGIAIDDAGDILVADASNSRIQEFTGKGEYLGQFGAAGAGPEQFNEPRGLAIDSKGDLLVADSDNNRVERWTVSSAADSQVIYYTPGTEASVAICQKHPEWANLPCQTQPAQQPETSGLPTLPVTTFAYNIWDEPEITKSTTHGPGGEATRTDTVEYDPIGREISKATTSSTGETLPKIKYEYSPETGLLVKQSTGSGTEEKKILSEYNKLGEMTSYTDADGNTATYEYENGGDARLKSMNDGKGTQTYTYEEEKLGQIKEIADTAAGKFKATYDPEGNLTSETLPDGLTNNIGYNAVGEPTSLEYHKANNCGTTCTWYTDTVVPSIQGRWMTQTSTLTGAATTTQNYAYDTSGRLTEAQKTVAGKGCTAHLYTYDQDGNRTTLTTRTSSESKCPTEGGTTETHSYDTADRLIDPGIAYNPFGDIETVTATDAGGSELTSKYYADGQVQTQTQNAQTVGYALDPGRRIRETTSTGKIVSTEIQNYPGPGNTPSWSSEPSSGDWTRNIQGINGTLAAIQHNGETPVLQLPNLHGDIIATAYDSETQTTLASSIAEPSEYGIPATEKPPKYSWLGAHELPTELSSGATVMGARSYIPQLGRFLQPDPQPGGSANAYAYTHDNPLNETDLSGNWTLNQTSGGLTAVGTGTGTTPEGGTFIAEGAIMPAPVNLQIEQAFQENPPWDQTTAGNEEYEEYEEEWWEEEGEEWEYAAYHRGAGHDEAHAEPGLLYQPLTGSRAENQTNPVKTNLVALCQSELKHDVEPNQYGACARYVHWYSGITKTIWQGVKLAVRWASESYYNPDVKWEPAPWKQIFEDLPRYDYGVPPLE